LGCYGNAARDGLLFRCTIATAGSCAFKETKTSYDFATDRRRISDGDDTIDANDIALSKQLPLVTGPLETIKKLGIFMIEQAPIGSGSELYTNAETIKLDPSWSNF
jgi:hypothetical protein